MDVIDVLIEDHRKVQELFEALGINVGDRSGFAHQLSQSLRQHTSAEEAIVYPAICAALPDMGGQMTAAIEEHHQVEELLNRLDETSGGDSSFDQLIGEIRDNVERHVAEEETQVFPRFREATSEDERMRIGRQVQAMKQ